MNLNMSERLKQRLRQSLAAGRDISGVVSDFLDEIREPDAAMIEHGMLEFHVETSLTEAGSQLVSDDNARLAARDIYRVMIGGIS
jgi:hypothetical protein